MVSFPHLTAPLAAQHQMRATTPSASQVDKKIQQGAEGFEAVALGEMMQPMFETVDTSGKPFGGGSAEKQFRSLQVLELGKQIARNGGVGIAHQVYQTMQKMQSHSGNGSR
ncbi:MULTISPECIES: rod-binding protein [unclassified Saccharibacter]|uniref:rod-binding protein n=1 Tax=unclassified Saccharibacter TaxID=2648722 RepID=UPI001EF0DD7E|nr:MULTISPECIES: rod-binding protein [unclassified Saccharibacter]